MTRSQKIMCGVALAAVGLVLASTWLTFLSAEQDRSRSPGTDPAGTSCSPAWIRAEARAEGDAQRQTTKLSPRSFGQGPSLEKKLNAIVLSGDFAHDPSIKFPG